MIDRQTAADLIAGVPTVVAPLSVSPPTVVPPGGSNASATVNKAGLDVVSGKTGSAGGSSAFVVGSSLRPFVGSNVSATVNKAGLDVVSGKTGGSSAFIVGSSLQPGDTQHPAGTSPRPGTQSSYLSSGTPAIIEASPSLAQQAEIGQAVPRVPHVTSHGGTDADAVSYIPFTVTPASGEIAAGAAAEILVKFCPLDVSEYFACLSARY